MVLEIVAGHDPREAMGYAVCAESVHRRMSRPVRVAPLMERALRYQGIYTRKHEERDGQLYDVISDAPMSTQFANSRFLSLWLTTSKWVLFCDFSDMLFQADPLEILEHADDRFAVQVVKHQYTPAEFTKMDGQMQTVYKCKNWSSVILWNREHFGNQRLSVDMVNTLPGRDLHRFCWLHLEEIGDLPHAWNWLVGVDKDENGVKPKLLHYTLGAPFMPGYENGPYSNVWKAEKAILDSTSGRVW